MYAHSQYRIDEARASRGMLDRRAALMAQVNERDHKYDDGELQRQPRWSRTRRLAKALVPGRATQPVSPRAHGIGSSA
jgi:hypothetical protein